MHMQRRPPQHLTRRSNKNCTEHFTVSFRIIHTYDVTLTCGANLLQRACSRWSVITSNASNTTQHHHTPNKHYRYSASGSCSPMHLHLHLHPLPHQPPRQMQLVGPLEGSWLHRHRGRILHFHEWLLQAPIKRRLHVVLASRRCSCRVITKLK